MEEAEKELFWELLQVRCFPAGSFICDLLLESGIFLPALVLLHGGCAAGMLVIGCNLKRGSLLLKAILTLYFAAFLCGGFWEVIVSDKSDSQNVSDPCSSNVAPALQRCHI